MNEIMCALAGGVVVAGVMTIVFFLTQQRPRASDTKLVNMVDSHSLGVIWHDDNCAVVRENKVLAYGTDLREALARAERLLAQAGGTK